MYVRVIAGILRSMRVNECRHVCTLTCERKSRSNESKLAPEADFQRAFRCHRSQLYNTRYIRAYIYISFKVRLIQPDYFALFRLKREKKQKKKRERRPARGNTVNCYTYTIFTIFTQCTNIAFVGINNNIYTYIYSKKKRAIEACKREERAG